MVGFGFEPLVLLDGKNHYTTGLHPLEANQTKRQDQNPGRAGPAPAILKSLAFLTRFPITSQGPLCWDPAFKEFTWWLPAIRFLSFLGVCWFSCGFIQATKTYSLIAGDPTQVSFLVVSGRKNRWQSRVYLVVSSSTRVYSP